MNNKKFKIKGLWFFGLSGSGKTTSSNFIKEKLIKHSLLLDGDVFRKYISNDLGYDIKDRTIQINRILGMCKICLNSNIFPICSSVYMNQKILDELDDINIKPIKIEREFSEIKKLKIYSNMDNVLGMDLDYEKKFDVKIIKNVSKNELYKNLISYINQTTQFNLAD